MIHKTAIKTVIKTVIYYQIVEYAENGCLFDYIANNGLSEELSANIFYEIVKSLKYIQNLLSDTSIKKYVKSCIDLIKSRMPITFYEKNNM